MRRVFHISDNPYYYDLGLLFARVCAGSFMLSHGWPKLMKLLADGPVTFGDPLGIGTTVSLCLVIFAEFFCSVLVIMGLATRVAVLPIMFTMLVAGLVVHGSHPFKEAELALVYFVVFFLLFLTGSGRYSIDRFVYKAL